MSPATSSPLEAVERHIAAMPVPHRTSIEVLRERLRVALPDADEMMKYGMPSFVLHGKGVAAYDAFKEHCSYFPMSGSVLDHVTGIPAGWTRSKGGLRFPIDQPPSQALVRRLVKARLAEIAEQEAVRTPKRRSAR